jgi:hypothetical protein
MRKLIVQQWVTVDNIAAEEDGGLSFVSGEPFSEKTDPALKASVMGFIDSVDTMILGATPTPNPRTTGSTPTSRASTARSSTTSPSSSSRQSWMTPPGATFPPRP